MPPRKRKRVSNSESSSSALPPKGSTEYSSDGLSFGDDDDLPDLSTSCSKTKKERKFCKDDVVWAPYEHIYWPAVVTSVTGRRVRLLWVNEARRPVFKKKANLLISFDNDATNSELKQLGEKAYVNFKDAYELVTKYFLKKSLSADTISARRYLTLSSEQDSLALHKDTLYRLGCKVDYPDNVSVDFNFDSSGESGESEDSEDCEETVVEQTPDEFQKELETLPELQEEVLQSLKKEAEQILQHVKSEDCFQFLKGIRDGAIASFRHKAYPNQDLLASSGLGPFSMHLTENFLDVIEDYCEQLKNVDPAYKLQVFIPEAIIFSYMQSNNVDRETATSQYRKACDTIGKKPSQ